jgi:hypothetical protein
VIGGIARNRRHRATQSSPLMNTKSVDLVIPVIWGDRKTRRAYRGFTRMAANRKSKTRNHEDTKEIAGIARNLRHGGTP